MPRILADENIPSSLVLLLQSRKVKVIWIPRTKYRGYSDRELIEIANKGKLVILTRDREYVELELRKLIQTGVIYAGLRINDSNMNGIANQIIKMLPQTKRRAVLIDKGYISIEKLI